MAANFTAVCQQENHGRPSGRHRVVSREQLPASTSRRESVLLIAMAESRRQSLLPYVIKQICQISVYSTADAR